MAELKEDKLVVPADKGTAKKKVSVELEVDTSVKDLGPNPYAKLIHLARAVDSWRIFPRVFITTYRRQIGTEEKNQHRTRRRYQRTRQF